MTDIPDKLITKLAIHDVPAALGLLGARINDMEENLGKRIEDMVGKFERHERQDSENMQILREKLGRSGISTDKFSHDSFTAFQKHIFNTLFDVIVKGIAIAAMLKLFGTAWPM